MYNSDFFHDARLTCTQVTDLLLKGWTHDDDAEQLRNVLQDLLRLKDYLHAQEIEAEDREAQQQRLDTQTPVLDLGREVAKLAAVDERIGQLERTLRS